jgi:20S proteasome subunit beta 6
MLGITPAQRQPLPDYSVRPAEPLERRWSPYSDNGGSTVAVAGEDFVVVASDTRLTNGGFGILSRNVDKLFQLTDESVLAACGCWGDVLTLTKLVNARIKMYKYNHNRTMTTPATAQMLANMLYSKRFFPYSVRNILAGLDDNGIYLKLILFLTLSTL